MGGVAERKKTRTSASEERRPVLWWRYVDDTLEKFEEHVQELTKESINQSINSQTIWSPWMLPVTSELHKNDMQIPIVFCQNFRNIAFILRKDCNGNAARDELRHPSKDHTGPVARERGRPTEEEQPWGGSCSHTLGAASWPGEPTVGRCDCLSGIDIMVTPPRRADKNPMTPPGDTCEEGRRSLLPKHVRYV